VLLRIVVGRSVDRAAIGLVPFELDRLAALECIEARLRGFRDRALFVTAWHEGECTLGLVPAALAVSGLAKRYGNVGALIGVDLTVERGELVGLLGPNGAGKSTLVKIACGLVRPSAGHAEVCGARAGTREARAALGYLAEFFRFPGWTSADELLELHQRLVSSDGGERERGELLELVGLADARTRRVEEMSKGMQQRLGIAQALVGQPRLLLLDEPTSALDPVGRRTVRALLEELRRRGVSVLLNSHLLSEVELVCDRVTILLAGKVVAAGTPGELEKPRGVEVDTDQGTAVYAQAGREDVPRLVEQLVRDGRKIYGARVLTSTLEEVYVEAVGGETQ
jgi:ABC-2 type transport system ATP-binding protein